MRKINSKIHGIIDYIVVLFLCFSPALFNLAPITATLTYSLAGIHLLLTLTTNFELGVYKRIPLNIHGRIELGVSIVLTGVAFVLGSLEGTVSLEFYLFVAITVFIVWILTDYHSTIER